MARFLQCGRYTLTLDRPLVMGVVNVTPDSFSDGGKYATTATAVAHARRLIDEGADIIDLGGESTRPGAASVALDEERRRVLPVLEKLASTSTPVSVDTQKAPLMRDALVAGASMINDINALQAPEAFEAVTASNAAICVMHKQGTPADMQREPHYDDVVAEVFAFLDERVRTLRLAGVAESRITVDPGFGFGKTLAHNLDLLRHLERFRKISAALLVGISRKSMLGRITGHDERLPASIAAAVMAVERGAQIVRVHDVAATRDAVAVFAAVTAALGAPRKNV